MEQTAHDKFNQMKDERESKKVSLTTFGIIITLLTFVIGACLTISIRAQDKAIDATERISTVEGNIKGINEKIESINDKLDLITNYFKLVPKDIKSEVNKTTL